MREKQKKISLIQYCSIPFATRTYFLTLIILAFLDRYLDRLIYLNLSSNFFITILNYQVWRGLINFAFQQNLIALIIIIFHLSFYLPKFEKQNGSIVTIYEIITIGLLVQFLCLSYQSSVYLLNDNKLLDDWKIIYNIGAAGVFINLLVKFLFFNFKQINRKCSKRSIFTYIYPLLLTVLVSKIQNQLRIDMVAGYFLALIQCFIFRGGIIFYTPDTYLEKQKAIYWCKLNRIPLCCWANLNEEKIKPNKLLVVQANQFYIMRSYELACSKQTGNHQDFSQQEIETERGAFRNKNNKMMEQQIRGEGRGEKWQKEEIIEDQ